MSGNDEGFTKIPAGRPFDWVVRLRSPGVKAGLICVPRRLTGRAGRRLLVPADAYRAVTGRPIEATPSPSSNGFCGCIRNAEAPPSNRNPIDIRNGKYQLPVTSIT